MSAVRMSLAQVRERVNRLIKTGWTLPQGKGSTTQKQLCLLQMVDLVSSTNGGTAIWQQALQGHSVTPTDNPGNVPDYLRQLGIHYNDSMPPEVRQRLFDYIVPLYFSGDSESLRRARVTVAYKWAKSIGLDADEESDSGLIVSVGSTLTQSAKTKAQAGELDPWRPCFQYLDALLSVNPDDLDETAPVEGAGGFITVASI
jgi:hypothetical protein